MVCRKSLADTLPSQTIDLSRSTLYFSGYLDHMDLSDLFVGSFFFFWSLPPLGHKHQKDINFTLFLAICSVSDSWKVLGKSLLSEQRGECSVCVALVNTDKARLINHAAYQGLRIHHHISQMRTTRHRKAAKSLAQGPTTVGQSDLRACLLDNSALMPLYSSCEIPWRNPCTL